MTSDAQALTILRRAVPEVSPRRAVLVLCISRLETHHGDGWANTPGAEYGIGSGNVGAIHAGSSWTGAVFPAPEARWNPKTKKAEPYTGTFRLYDSIEDGFADLYRLLVNRYPKTVAAADAGQWDKVSAALYDEGYYTGTTPREQAIAAHEKVFNKVFWPIREVVNRDMRPSAAIEPGTKTKGSLIGWLASVGLATALLLGMAAVRRARRT